MSSLDNHHPDTCNGRCVTHGNKTPDGEYGGYDIDNKFVIICGSVAKSELIGHSDMTCTRPKNHVGKHVSCDNVFCNMASWENRYE